MEVNRDVLPVFEIGLILIRIHRKTFHQYFNANQVAAYRPVQLEASITLLHHMITTPEAFFSHVRQCVLSAFAKQFVVFIEDAAMLDP